MTWCMNSLRLVWWKRLIMARIEWCSGGGPGDGDGGVGPSGCRSRGGMVKRVAAAPKDKKAVGIREAAVEGNNIASIKAFIFHITAPTFGQHVTLTTVPIRVSESPTLP